MIKTYTIAIITAFLLPALFLMGIVATINADFTDETASVEEIVEESTEAVKTAKISITRAVAFEKGEDEEERAVSTQIEIEVVDPPVQKAVARFTDAEYPIYRCDGLVMDEDLQKFLYRCLMEHGIEYFFPYAISMACQESSFNIYDVTGGLDCGLFQYRKTYWAETCAKWGYPGADIFNPYIQIDIFVHQTARRLNELGCSVNETISRHYTSDWGTYNAKYVSDVMKRFSRLERIN